MSAGVEACGHGGLAASPEPPSPTASSTRSKDRRAVVERRRAQHDAQARVALALVGVSVFNAFAPLWGPALGQQIDHPTRAALERLLKHEQRIPSHSVLSTLDARCLQMRRAPLIEKADTALQAVDEALRLPAGSTRTLTIERALVAAGVAPEQARDAAHFAAAADQARGLGEALQRELAQSGVNLEHLGLRGADALDRMLADPHLAVAFAAGAAIAPRIAPPDAAALRVLGRIGHTLLNAKQRHDEAIAGLKSLHTGNPIVDVAGAVAGEVADLAAFSLAFIGPAPMLAAARGTDLLLLAARVIAAKTAVAGTLKAVGSYSDVPAEIVAFALGVAAQGTAARAATAARVEVDAVAAQRRVVGEGFASAIGQGDPREAIDAVLEAWQQATPREREALQSLVVQGAERLVTEAGAHAQLAP